MIMPMEPIIATALNTARRQGAHYADLRLVANREQCIVVRNGAVETMTADESAGLGIRVLYRGGWGFAATRDLTTAADAAAALAVHISRRIWPLKSPTEQGQTPLASPPSGFDDMP